MEAFGIAVYVARKEAKLLLFIAAKHHHFLEETHSA